VHSFDDLCESFFVFEAIEPTFGGQLSSIFGDERYLVRDDSLGDFDDGFSHRHFEIQFAGDGLLEQLDISVVYMSAVLAEMYGDTISAGELALDGSPDWVRLIGSSCLPDGSDVVDIDVKDSHFFRRAYIVFRMSLWIVKLM
jgi:hypothetical protein